MTGLADQAPTLEDCWPCAVCGRIVELPVYVMVSEVLGMVCMDGGHQHNFRLSFKPLHFDGPVLKEGVIVARPKKDEP